MNRTNEPEYKAWWSMKHRCLNNLSHAFHRYGGRGIKVCDRWLENYENFLNDMGRKPSLDYQLDRINNNGNYELSNCRWTTKKRNARNRCDNNLITYKSKTQCIADWADELNVPWARIASRIKRGYSVAQALGYENKPKVRMGNRKYLTYNGVTKSIAEWASDLGLKKNSLQKRLQNSWTLEDVLTRPRDPIKATSKKRSD